MRRATWLMGLAVVGLSVTRADGEDWTRFRGPNGTGVAEESGTLPAEWDATKNMRWKVDLPGPGLSSPIVVGDKIFLTCWTGYGAEEGNSDQQTLKRHLLCINRNSGETVWSRAIDPYLPEDEFGGMFAQNGYASHSPTSDGERVYVFFGKTGALAFDMDGNQLWKSELGVESDPRGWGSASSPILYQDLLIVTASAESEAVVALNKRTGEEVWRQEATGLFGVWATPTLVPVSDERTDLVVPTANEVWGFDPLTGKLRWYCAGGPGNTVTASAVLYEQMVILLGGRGGGSIAVRAGGEGDVTDSHVVWTGNERGGIGTPVIVDGRLYSISGGRANCVDAATGDRIFQARLESDRSEQDASGGADNEGEGESNGRGRGGRGGRGGFAGGQDYSSPVAADGKIFFIGRQGVATVLEPASELKVLATNRFADEGEEFSATPAISDDAIYARSNKRLYCIGFPK